MNNHRKEFLDVKGALEGLYSLYNRTKDADLSEKAIEDIRTKMDLADTAITNFTGALKGMKLTVEPCQQLYIDIYIYMYIAKACHSQGHPT